MRRFRLGLVLAVAAALALPAAAQARRLPHPPKDADYRDFAPGNFTAASSAVSNRFLPLVPGTQFVFSGQVTGGGTTQAHKVIFTVTDLTKLIDGVRTAVVWDRDIDGTVLGEAELAFFAQDADGNVWNMAEYPEEYDAGTFTGAPSTWVTGLAGARAGIAMRALPRVGSSPYIQGFIPGIEFKDQGTVVKEHQKTCVPTGCYSDVLVVQETNLFVPTDGQQLKYHAPNVGIVRIASGVGVPGGQTETLDLVALRHLGPAEMKKARAETLKLEKRAYKVSPVYAKTKPMEPIS